MQKIFLNPQGRLRNGWWIAVFAAIFIASQGVYRPVSKALQHQGVEGIWLSPLPVVFLLLVTWACTRLRGDRLSSIGLQLDGRWLRQALLGRPPK